METGFYTPYTTLIQASGTGKTKLLYTIAESVKAIYCCLREPSSTGYPPRSYIANTLLGSRDPQNVYYIYLAYIVACVTHLLQFQGSPGQWLHYHTQSSTQQEFWRDIGSQIEKLKSSFLKTQEPLIQLIKPIIGVDTAAQPTES